MHAPLLNESVFALEPRNLAIRPVHHGDDRLIADMYRRLSDLSRELRFMAPLGRMSDEEMWRQASRLTEGDPATQSALLVVAPDGDEEEVIAVAEYVRETHEPTSAEIGVVVRDDYQRQGIGSALMQQLMQVARSQGIMTATAYLLPSNEGVRRMIRRLGVPFTMETRRGLTTFAARLQDS